jgi:hypothetical protein
MTTTSETTITTSSWETRDGDLYFEGEKMPPEMVITTTAKLLANHLERATAAGVALARAGGKRRKIERDALGRIVGISDD